MGKIFGVSVAILLFLCALSQAELVDNGDGTVSDTDTGLMWQQAGPAAMTWEDALGYCEALVLADFDDWRLPSRNELMSIADYSFYDPTADTVIFPDMKSEFYWSSTTVFGAPLVAAWMVGFRDGYVWIELKANPINVRAVRGGPIS